MYGEVGFWGWPADGQRDQFEQEYLERYVPALEAVPGASRLDVFKATESGRESDIYRVGGIYFADAQTHASAMASSQWAAAGGIAVELIEKYRLGMRYTTVTG